jgi:alpha-1,2-mannosyltransferase
LGLTFFFFIVISYCYAGAIGAFLAISAPAAWICLWEGQNGFLTAALLGTFLLLLPRFKTAAGATLALFVIKPHLAIAAPFALFAGREKKVFITAALVVCALLGITTLLLGHRIWLAYFEYGLPSAGKMLTIAHGGIESRLVSFYGALMLQGLGVQVAMGLHALFALTVIVCTAWVFARTRDPDIRAAALALSAVMISPMVYDYDLPITLLAFFALLRLSLRTPLLMHEWLVLGTLYFTPLLTYPAQAEHLGFNPVFVSLISLFGMVVFRAKISSVVPIQGGMAEVAKIV